MPFAAMTFQQWIDKIELTHPAQIELGLDRISQVAKSMLLPITTAKVVLVAGSNGKGSSVAIMESISLLSDYKTFSYTSPHVSNFNERIRINGKPAEEALLIEAFKSVELARQNVALTFFEFTTLAAMWVESQVKPQVSFYEVGLGGRLDATNIHHPDLCLITSLSLEHMDWLGDSIEAIAYEKTSIARKGKPIIFADNGFPEKSYQVVKQINACLYQLGIDFNYQELNEYPKLTQNGLPNKNLSYQGLNHPVNIQCPINLHIKNVVAACFSLELLLNIKIHQKLINSALKRLFLPGRFEPVKLVNQYSAQIFLDVSHNKQAIEQLYLRISRFSGPVTLVCGILKDKLQNDIFATMKDLEAKWAVADLPGDRGASSQQIMPYIPHNHQKHCFSSVAKALDWALVNTDKCGKIVVFGSFVTVDLAKCHLNLNPNVLI